MATAAAGDQAASRASQGVVRASTGPSAAHRCSASP
jgi:hypothetical protein